MQRLLFLMLVPAACVAEGDTDVRDYPPNKSEGAEVVDGGNLQYGASPSEAQLRPAEFHEYRFRALAGAKVSLEVMPQCTDDIDTVMYLFAPLEGGQQPNECRRGQSLAPGACLWNDSSGAGSRSRLSNIRLAAAGTYSVAVGLDRGPGGRLCVQLRCESGTCSEGLELEEVEINEETFPGLNGMFSSPVPNCHALACFHRIAAFNVFLPGADAYPTQAQMLEAIRESYLPGPGFSWASWEPRTARDGRDVLMRHVRDDGLVLADIEPIIGVLPDDTGRYGEAETTFVFVDATVDEGSGATSHTTLYGLLDKVDRRLFVFELGATRARCSDRDHGAFVTIGKNSEHATFWTEDFAFIDVALDRLHGTGTPMFARLRAGTDCGNGFSWHVDPRTARLGGVSIELCDARLSYVEEHRDPWLANPGSYCPWGMTFEAVDDRR